jgi:hypothetical protein
VRLDRRVPTQSASGISGTAREAIAVGGHQTDVRRNEGDRWLSAVEAARVSQFGSWPTDESISLRQSAISSPGKCSSFSDRAWRFPCPTYCSDRPSFSPAALDHHAVGDDQPGPAELSNLSLPMMLRLDSARLPPCRRSKTLVPSQSTSP